MLKTRIAPALALAAAVALGTTGCGFMVPQATTYEYAPSDGIDIDLPSADVRNFLVVAGEDSANIVFTGVNKGDAATRVTVRLVDGNEQVSDETFSLEPGSTPFGVETPEIVEVSLKAGSMVTAFVENDGTEIERQVPVVDGTLDEYSNLVP
ncbi:DNA modification methylase [Leucobacter sp. UCMA 4100]|uniref:DNA modification methylase n=1 Tax=Leucobacter sp. UCMA 4100 TaxID=2810534 RepID=UPI0022EA1271|nr:DNA modification methylase [Leucobacter sp. UCMA 4100]MDA3146403.1 DNA modification methylase [Leucobacter sp. UCMA 4100]